MSQDPRIEAAAAAIFCHAQFRGDDYAARRLAENIVAAIDIVAPCKPSLPEPAGVAPSPAKEPASPT